MRGNLQEELKIALQIDADVRTHKEELLLLIGNMQAMQRKKKRIGFIEFILRQIRFMGKNLWLTQGAAAFAMFGIGYLSTGKDIEGLCIRHIPLLLGVFAIMQVMASIPLLLTSYRYQMHEIEMASRISLPRLLMAKLIILAVEYLAVFVFCVGHACREPCRVFCLSFACGMYGMRADYQAYGGMGGSGRKSRCV